MIALGTMQSPFSFSMRKEDPFIWEEVVVGGGGRREKTRFLC